MGGAGEPSPAQLRATRIAQAVVMVGLLLTLLGFALLSYEVPANGIGVGQLLPLLGTGMIALWIGGILLGNALRPFGRRGR